MEALIITLLGLAAIVVVVTLVSQVRGNRSSHASGSSVELPHSWIAIALNVAVLVILTVLLVSVVNLL